MSSFPGIRSRPEVRQPLPAGSRLSWSLIALWGEPWPGEPPRHDPSAEASDNTDGAEAPLWANR